MPILKSIDDRKDWIKCLDSIFLLVTVPKTSTHNSTIEMIYGHKPMMPIRLVDKEEVVSEAPVRENTDSVLEAI